jgi:hypothetical protein
MKDYLLLFRGGDGATLQQSPEQWQAHMQKWMQWMGGLQQQGKFIGGQPLEQTGKQILGTKKVVTDGPFMEGKEYVGGYLMIKADTLDAATELSKGCPILEFDNGHVEVREIKELKM